MDQLTHDLFLFATPDAAALPANAVQHPSARPAHALTEELYRRLEAER